MTTQNTLKEFAPYLFGAAILIFGPISSCLPESQPYQPQPIPIPSQDAQAISVSHTTQKQTGTATMAKAYISGHPDRPNIPQGATVTVNGTTQILGAGGQYFTALVVIYGGFTYYLTPDYLAR